MSFTDSNLSVFKLPTSTVCQVEALWAQVHLPLQAPILVGCVYMPPSSKVSYLDDLCTGFDQATDSNKRSIYLG